jgi:hypothetical protein
MVFVELSYILVYNLFLGTSDGNLVSYYDVLKALRIWSLMANNITGIA